MNTNRAVQKVAIKRALPRLALAPPPSREHRSHASHYPATAGRLHPRHALVSGDAHDTHCRRSLASNSLGVLRSLLISRVTCGYFMRNPNLFPPSPRANSSRNPGSVGARAHTHIEVGAAAASGCDAVRFEQSEAEYTAAETNTVRVTPVDKKFPAA